MAREFCGDGFLTVSIAIIATSVLVLWGLRGTAAEANDSWRHSEFNIPQRRKHADHKPGHQLRNRIPERIAAANEVAESVLLLASGEANFVSGHRLVIDDGYTVA